MEPMQGVGVVVSSLMGVSGFIVALVVALKNNKRTNVGDVEAQATKQTEQIVLLRQTRDDVADIKHDLKHFDDKLDKQNERLFKTEENLKAMWRVIDEIKAFMGFASKQERGNK